MQIETPKHSTRPAWTIAATGSAGHPQSRAAGGFKRGQRAADIDHVNSGSARSPRVPVVPDRRETAMWCMLALGATLGMLWGWDWQIQFNDWGSEAATSFAHLLAGHVGAFLSTAPSYGPSLLLRAPFALPASLAGGSGLLIYRLSALPCSLALAALGVWLAVTLRRNGRGRVSAFVTVLLCAANPIAFKAITIGHPEELLGAALCVVAVLLAARGRTVLAMVALGVAIANKQWALLAAGPVLLALPRHRLRALFWMAAVAAALEAPLIASGGIGRLVINDTGETFHPWQGFWFLGQRGHWVPDMAPYIPRGFRIAPAWVAERSHAMIVWLTVPLTLLAAWRRMHRQDALLLLAFFLAMRCLLDPWDNIYYPLSFIVVLGAWEAAVANRLPIGAAIASGATWVIFDFLPPHLAGDAQALSFIVPATLAFAAIAAVVFRLRTRHADAATMRAAATSAVSRPRAVPS
jgi:hypothetical protein